LLVPVLQVNTIEVCVLKVKTSVRLIGASGLVKITAPVPATDVSESP